MSYFKILPRDLYLQSKLLTQLGHLALYIVDYEPDNLSMTETLEEDISISQLADGELTCTNITFYTKNKTPIILFINCPPFNKELPKDSYSLRCLNDEYLDMLVFNEDKSLTKEFVDYINNN